jgi:hypothetical protein
MDRGQKGSATAEYLSVVTLFTAAIIALGGLGVPQAVASAIAGAVETAICRIGANDSCGSTASDEAASPDVSLDERVAHLEDSAARRRDELLIETPDAAGSRFAELHFAVLEALEAGRIDEAEQLDALLEMYIRLSRGEHLQGSDRGGLVEDLWMSGNKWRQAVARGTIYLGPDGDNFRYLDIPASPGDGLIVLDFFIPFETSGPPPVELKGDDRTFHPDGPLSSELPLNKSRILIILDRETGRAAIYQSHTCNVFYGQCREARPIALDLDDRTQFVPELSNDVTGPYIAPTNRFEIDADGDSIRLTYDALNSLTWPVFAVEGTVELTRTPEGTYAITHDRRDHYPAIGIYQYRPGQEPWIIEERPSEEALEGASDMEWLPPWWPWGGNDDDD